MSIRNVQNFIQTNYGFKRIRFVNKRANLYVLSFDAFPCFPVLTIENKKYHKLVWQLLYLIQDKPLYRNQKEFNKLAEKINTKLLKIAKKYLEDEKIFAFYRFYLNKNLRTRNHIWVSEPICIHKT